VIDAGDGLLVEETSDFSWSDDVKAGKNVSKTNMRRSRASNAGF
jgi:hypothetical protein